MPRARLQLLISVSLAILRELGSTNTYELSRFADIYDPRARKLELVRAGHNIHTARRNVKTESGERHSLGVYALLPGSKAGE